MDDFIKNECGITLPAAALSAAFMIEGSHLRKIPSKAQNKPKAAYRPLALTENEESAVIRLIRDGNSSGNYVTQRDVLNFVAIPKMPDISLGRILFATPRRYCL
jgi:hypothetical protein